jgi:hypothetical protein
MSTALARIAHMVRWRTRDRAPRERLIGTPELNEMIQSNALALSGRIPLGEKWANGVVTITAGSDLATLPQTEGNPAQSIVYMTVLDIRRTSDGQRVTKRTREEMDILYWRSGLASTHVRQEPSDYAFIEDEDQKVTLRFQAPVKTTGTLDVLRATLPKDLLSDASTVPFSPLAIEALCDMVAMECIAKLPDKDVAEKLHLGKTVLKVWADRIELNVASEQDRRRKLESVGRPLRMVP